MGSFRNSATADLRVNDKRARIAQTPVQRHSTRPAATPQDHLGGLHAPRHRAGDDRRPIPDGQYPSQRPGRSNSPGCEGHINAELSGGNSLPLRVPDNQRDVGPLRDRCQPFRNGRHGVGDVQRALALMTELTAPVSTTSSSSKPARVSRLRNWASVRSAPPVITSMFRSSNPPAPEESSNTISIT